MKKTWEVPVMEEIKKYLLVGEDLQEELYIGKANDIALLYKAFEKEEVYLPRFFDEPKFSMDKIYGLSIENDRYMSVVNSDFLVRVMLDMFEGIYLVEA